MFSATICHYLEHFDRKLKGELFKPPPPSWGRGARGREGLGTDPFETNLSHQLTLDTYGLSITTLGLFKKLILDSICRMFSSSDTDIMINTAPDAIGLSSDPKANLQRFHKYSHRICDAKSKLNVP